SNALQKTGDGYKFAYNVGADLLDMEQVQFHPTGMVWPFGVKGILVTEGVRGEGGVLLNNKGERFMLKYSPEKKELDARDIVARAVYKEINKGNGTEHGGVYLDISHKGADFIKEKLPSMYTQFKELANVDITKDKMEVAPTVHYIMGGIMVDPETGMTNVKGLFAAGESASGLHGANRLGGNSLADILVFGKRTGLKAAEHSRKERSEKISDAEAKNEIERISSYLGEGTNPHLLTERLRSAMSEHVGIVRSGAGLKKALKATYELRKESRKAKVKGDIKFNQGLIECIELDNMLLLAECIIKSALERKECRGAHTRRDYPRRDDPEWNVNIVCKNVDGSIKFEKKPVPEMPDRLKRLITKKAGH
ncbi:MAG: FAD-binding protein, partial [Candidatus Micrarchaeales archaeon]